MSDFFSANSASNLNSSPSTNNDPQTAAISGVSADTNPNSDDADTTSDTAKAAPLRLVETAFLASTASLIWLDGFADSMEKFGRLREAETLRERSLAIAEESYGIDNVGAASSLYNLAQLHVRAKRNREAIDVVKRRLELAETKYGMDNIGVANYLGVMSATYSAVGEHR